MVTWVERQGEAAVRAEAEAEIGGPGPEVAGTREHLGYQPALDGVRAVSILGVVISHLSFTLRSGGHGVDVFFVLSGFLITTLLLQEHASTGRVSLRAFWWRRAARLLPALLLMCPIVFVAFVVTQPSEWRASALGVGTALLYVSAWVRALGISGLGWMAHTWSLSVEEWFYAVWPLVVVVALRRARPARWIGAAAAVAIVYRLGSEHAGLSALYLYDAPDQRAVELLVGCAAGAWLLLLGDRARVHRRLFLWAAAIGGLVVVARVARVAAPDTSWGLVFSSGDSTIFALATAAVIVSLVAVPDSGLARTLALRPLVWIGRRSYSLYLWHFPIYGLILLGHGHLSGWKVWGARILVVGLSFAAAALSYRFVERPAIRWVREREAARRRAPQVGAPLPVRA